MTDRCRRPFFAGLLVCLFGMFSLPVAAVDLRLKREATLAGDVLRLGMVAEISGAGERRDWWANLELARLAPDRETLVLDQQEVVRVLRARTAEPFSLIGSSVTVRAASFLLSAEELIRFVRGEVARQWAGRRVNVVFSGNPADLRLRGARAELSIDPAAGGRPLGLVEIGILVRREGMAPLRLAVACRVEVPTRVVVARRNLRVGTTVRAGDFRIEEQDGAPADAVADPALLEGRRLVRVLPSGALARQEAFERPLLVKRGDRLLLTVGDGGVVVEAPLEALASGREDDLIECRNPLTGTLLKARITGPGTAVPEANK